MNELAIFESNGVNVRVIVDERDQSIWFVLKDVLAAMETFTRPSDAKESIIQVFGKGVVFNYPLYTVGGKQNVTIISEAATTFLISRSNTEAGKNLNRKIHSEILPSIRKTGTYSVRPKLEVPQTLADALQLAADQARELERTNQKLIDYEDDVNTLKRIQASEGSRTLTDAGKTFKKPPRKLIWFLIDEGYLYRGGGKILPKEIYVRRGYLEMGMVEYANGKIDSLTFITNKGMGFFSKVIQDYDELGLLGF